MTAHRSFGARTGGAPLIMGTSLLVLAVGMGAGLATVLAHFPVAILAGLLAVAGVLHITLARDLRARTDWLVAAVVGVLGLSGPAGDRAGHRAACSHGSSDRLDRPVDAPRAALMGDDGGHARPRYLAPRKRPRGFETTRDMVLSMAVVGAVVLGIFWMVAWQRPEVQGPIRPEVDVEQVFTDVRLGDTFPVLEPTDLPDGWIPTSAWFDTEPISGEIGGGVLHVGYVTPDGSYAEVRQTDGDANAAVAEWVDAASPVADVVVKDRSWTLVESEETGKQGLVANAAWRHRRGDGQGVAEASLEELAASLALTTRRRRRWGCCFEACTGTVEPLLTHARRALHPAPTA